MKSMRLDKWKAKSFNHLPHKWIKKPTDDSNNDRKMNNRC